MAPIGASPRDRRCQHDVNLGGGMTVNLDSGKVFRFVRVG